MKHNTLLFFLTILLFLTVGCTRRSYFTTEIRKKVESKGYSLDKLQYYIDRDVTLKREETADEKTQVSSGKVKIEDGKRIRYIYLKKYTPGVCITQYDKSLAIAFEVGDGKYIVFGEPSNSDIYAHYSMYGKEWNYGHGKISYDGKTWGVNTADLMIKKSIVDKLTIEKRVMKGRKIN